MRIPSAINGALLAGSVAIFILAATFALADFMQKRLEITQAKPALQISNQIPIDGALAASGRHLFLMNCAHCHGDDATGDEGPDLHGLHKTDARIAAIISDGIKGEMPRFNQKLKNEDVQALIAFLHTLKG